MTEVDFVEQTMYHGCPVISRLRPISDHETPSTSFAGRW